MKHLVPLFNVGVHRDITTTLQPSVPAHEIPILEAIHGRDNVFPGEQENETALDADTEYDRLCRKFGDDVVKEAYGATAFGDIKRQVISASVGTVDDDDSVIKLEGPDSKPGDKAKKAEAAKKPRKTAEPA